MRKRLSILWEVPLFHIDVDVRGLKLQIQVNGEKPSAEQMSLFEAHVRASTQAALRAMN